MFVVGGRAKKNLRRPYRYLSGFENQVVIRAPRGRNGMGFFGRFFGKRKGTEPQTPTDGLEQSQDAALHSDAPPVEPAAGEQEQEESVQNRLSLQVLYPIIPTLD